MRPSYQNGRREDLTVRFFFGKIAGLFFLLQGVAGFSWWVTLHLNADIRKFFSLYPDYPDSIYSFALPDLLIFCMGSLICSYGILLKKKWVETSVYYLSGGVLYISLFCINHYLVTGFAVMSAVLMSLSALVTTGVSAIYIINTK